jgi:phytoene dehydrogenase-like protein
MRSIKRNLIVLTVVQLFDRYATYSGSSPYKAPGMLTLIPHLECNKGVFYPEGGMMAINKALYNLALKKGVAFSVRCTLFNASSKMIMKQKAL